MDIKEVASLSMVGSAIKVGEARIISEDTTSIFRAISESMGTGPPVEVQLPINIIPTLHSFVCDSMGLSYETTPAS